VAGVPVEWEESPFEWVVTLNERLDYFGSTVNVAARLAGLSQGSET
jgi:hypothetical protein